MFFSISDNYRNNFSHSYTVGNFCIDTDAGWHEHDVDGYYVLYKGYIEGSTLLAALDKIIAQTTPVYLGNFCAMVYDKGNGTLAIKSDRYRSFPLYVGQRIVTNLEKHDRTVWADEFIEIGSNFDIVDNKFDVIGDIDTDVITVNEAISKIDSILSRRTEDFLKYNTLPINVHLSGGVDSMLVYSYLQKYTNKFTKIPCQHHEYDKFWLANSDTISDSYWGYSQIHHWVDPCVLLSGAPGDEFMLRSPTTSDMLMKYHNVRIQDILDSAPADTYYHQQYFNRPKNYNIFATQLISPRWDLKQVMYRVCNTVANDWQHWHLGNTITWTPLRDLEIFKILIRLAPNDALGQILDSKISIKLIENNNPELLAYLSSQKNSSNSLKNLVGFYF